MAITIRGCEKKGGEVVDENNTKYCRIEISKRTISPKMKAHQERFRQAAKRCKGTSNYRSCMSTEMKR